MSNCFQLNLLLILLVFFCNGPFAASVNLRDPSTTISKENHDRPLIYTFFQLKLKDNGVEDKIDEHELLLDAWIEAWSERGWDPVVLTLDDAKKHPDYDYYNDKFKNMSQRIFEGSYNYLCLMRWLAIAAQQEDAYMSDYDTFPLNIRVEDGLNLPNSGAFSGYERFVPSLMSGSASEWDRIAKAVLDRALKKFDDEGPNVKYSDMLALRDGLNESRETKLFISTLQVVSYPYSKIGKMICMRADKSLAAHLSHAYTDRAYNKFHVIPGNKGRHEYSRMVLNDWREQCSPEAETKL